MLLAHKGFDLRKLEWEIDVQEQSFLKFSENLEQVRIDHLLELQKISNVNIAQEPSFSITPTGPKRLINIILGIFIGIIGGFGLAFLSEFLNHHFRHAEDIERQLLIPCLSVVPNFIKRKKFLKVPKHTFDGKRIPTLVSNYYETLRDRLIMPGDTKINLPYSIAVSSFHSEEGASTVAVNLAVTMATHNDGKVLLIDTNYTKPSLHTLFKTKQDPGFLDLVRDQPMTATGIQETEIPNLFFMPCGQSQSRDIRPFESELFKKVLRRCKKRIFSDHL